MKGIEETMLTFQFIKQTHPHNDYGVGNRATLKIDERQAWQKLSIRNNKTMFIRLILLLTIVPFIELVILLQVHKAISDVWGSGIGLLVTLGTIIVTGIAGAALARQQGLSVIRQVQQQLGKAQVPGQALADGILVLVGAALLLTPGFLTDIFGFSLLIPASRAFYRSRVMNWFQHNVRVHRAGGADVFVVDSVSRSDAEPNAEFGDSEDPRLP